MLAITESSDDKPIIARLKKSLLSKFRPNSENDIELATRLSHYLLVVDDAASARSLLESYLYFDELQKEEKFQHLWATNTDGMILLAYIEELSGNTDRCNELVEIIELSEIHEAEDSDEHFDELADLHEEHDFHVSDMQNEFHYKNETHKIRCEVLSGLRLHYILYLVLHKYTLGSDPEKMEVQLPIVRERIDTLGALLKDEILNKR